MTWCWVNTMHYQKKIQWLIRNNPEYETNETLKLPGEDASHLLYAYSPPSSCNRTQSHMLIPQWGQENDRAVNKNTGIRLTMIQQTGMCLYFLKKYEKCNTMMTMFWTVNRLSLPCLSVCIWNMLQSTYKSAKTGFSRLYYMLNHVQNLSLIFNPRGFFFAKVV